MNQQQAIAKLRKLIGPKLGYRVDRSAPDAEQREVIRARWQEASAKAKAAQAAKQARYEELLKGDAQYQDLKAKAIEAEKEASAAGAGIHSYKVTVGRIEGPFFSVVAQGDNWDDVVEEAKTKAK